MNNTHTIWNSDACELYNYYSEHLDEVGLDDDAEISDDILWRLAYDSVEINRESEIYNLDIPTDNRIIIIAQLGLWDGIHSAYVVLDNNINQIVARALNCNSDIHIYAQDGEVRAEENHHDGCNHYLYRQLKGTPEECEPLLDAIYDKMPLTNPDEFKTVMEKYSTSLYPEVANVYGWN